MFKLSIDNEFDINYVHDDVIFDLNLVLRDGGVFDIEKWYSNRTWIPVGVYSLYNYKREIPSKKKVLSLKCTKYSDG